MPPPETAWHGHQGAGLHPSMNLPGPQGQQGQSITPVPPGGRQTTGPPGVGQNIMPAVAAPQALAAPQGGAQIAVHPTGNNGGGVLTTLTGRGAHGTTSQEYSGISMALEHLAPITTDADSSRNLRWQQSVAGDATKLALWKIEATSSPGLQFYAYMQHGSWTLNDHHLFHNDIHCHTSWKGSALHGGSQRDSQMRTDRPAPPKHFRVEEMFCH